MQFDTDERGSRTKPGYRNRKGSKSINRKTGTLLLLLVSTQYCLALQPTLLFSSVCPAMFFFFFFTIALVDHSATDLAGAF